MLPQERSESSWTLHPSHPSTLKSMNVRFVSDLSVLRHITGVASSAIEELVNGAGSASGREVIASAPAHVLHAPEPDTSVPVVAQLHNHQLTHKHIPLLSDSETGESSGSIAGAVEVKATDFGFSRYSSEPLGDFYCGTPLYMWVFLVH